MVDVHVGPGLSSRGQSSDKDSGSSPADATQTTRLDLDLDTPVRSADLNARDTRPPHLCSSSPTPRKHTMADPSPAPLPDGDAQTPQHEAIAADAAAAAAPNGTTNGSVDVEMKEDIPIDVRKITLPFPSLHPSRPSPPPIHLHSRTLPLHPTTTHNAG